MNVHSYNPYETGAVYELKHNRLYVLPDKPDADDRADFDNGYMLDDKPNFDMNAKLLCLQIRGSYIKFLFQDKLVWIFELDANSCLRPVT